MISYPKNYAPLAEEEMEYTSGGLSINWMALGSTVMGLATSMLAYLNVSNIAGVAVQLQKKDPEKYPEPEGTINGNLIIDSTLTYFSSVAGIGMGLLNIAAGVGTVYLGAARDGVACVKKLFVSRPDRALVRARAAQAALELALRLAQGKVPADTQALAKSARHDAAALTALDSTFLKG